MPYVAIPAFRDAVFRTGSVSALVDVAEAAHAKITGVVCVSCHESAREQVLKDLMQVLQQEQFQDAKLQDPARSVSMTVASAQSGTSGSPPVKTGKFAHLLKEEDWPRVSQPRVQMNSRSHAIPSDITTKTKSFSQALMGTQSDIEDDLTVETKPSRSSQKTTREIELETRNAQLEEWIADMQKQIEDLTQAFKSLTERMGPEPSPNKAPTKRARLRPVPVNLVAKAGEHSSQKQWPHPPAPKANRIQSQAQPKGQPQE